MDALAASHSTPEDVLARLSTRLPLVDKWSKFPFPLNNGGDIQATLSRAVADSPADVTAGLRHITQPSVSISAFAHGLVCMADGIRSDKLSRVHAVVPRSAIHQTLQVAVPEMRRLVIASSPDVRNQPAAVDLMVAAVFVQVFENLNIHYVPFVLTTAQHRLRIPVYNSWIMLGAARIDPKIRLNNELLSPEQIEERNAAAAQERIQSQDPRRAWECGPIRLIDLFTILGRHVRPSDWTLASAKSDIPWVQNIYTWSHDHFDMTDPIHRYAILTSIIISKLMPMHFLPPSIILPRNMQTKRDIREFAQTLDWVQHGDGRGHKDTSIFVVMLTTLFIALATPQGPLAIHLKSHGFALGADWTRKHCMYV